MESWLQIERPLWAEGVLVAPQHFQLWDRYQQRAQDLRVSAGSLHARGLLHLKLDDEALGNGVLRLRECRVVMSDGRVIAFDEQIDGPLEVKLVDLPEKGGLIYLGVPDNERAHEVPGYPEHSEAATTAGWRSRFAMIGDEHDPQRRREVMFASPNLRLFVGQPPAATWLSLPIAELVRNDDSSYIHSAHFIPACCRIAASSVLVKMLTNTIDRLQARVDILRRSQAGAGRVDDFEPSQIGRLLLLQTLQPVMAELRNLQVNPQAHPWHLFLVLIRLAAALMVFDPESDQDCEDRKLPVYKHNQLTEVMAEADLLVQQMLERALPRGVARLDLIAESPAILVVEGLNIEILDNKSIYLAVRLEDAQSVSWIDELPRQIKLGSRFEIEQIVASALPGIKVRHTPRPPNRLPVKSGYEYFLIEPSGEYWQRAREHGSLAVYLPLALQAARLDIVAVGDR
ncbi:type VI secretion system baseplate subunit TssK [Halorhodospira halochloris]|uniref:type VI secretion system baseplate subunit TssK n=1 Tax=Halorhodospira halochloris TaxID=1052 RepID=UPI001EE8AEE9|nr:type VI secretion system baseplate subunit TssK [Halorhodospira halochloris]MCG5529637.1 type VI secretion system baseplate subunit TssK [Halorhodospira halochloris]